MALIGVAAIGTSCKDVCGKKTDILADLPEPTLCSGELRFVDHRLQLNLAAAVPSEADAEDDADGDDGETTPAQVVPEAQVLVEAHNEQGRPAEFVNVVVEFMGRGLEDARKLASLEAGDQCRGGGRRVACTLDSEGEAALSLRSTGLIPTALDQSEIYYVVAFSGEPPTTDEVSRGIESLRDDSAESSEDRDEDEASDDLRNWDIAAVEVTLGLADVTIEPIGLEESVEPSAGQLGCNSSTCSAANRSQSLRFGLERAGQAVVVDFEDRLTLEVTVSDSSVAWLAYDSLGCSAFPSSRLELSYIGDHSNDFLLCLSGAGGEVILTTRVIAFLPPERLPPIWAAEISIAPEISRVTLDPDPVEIVAGESENVRVQALYCDGGAEHPLPGATLNVEAQAGIDVACSEAPCTQLVTQEFGRAEFDVGGIEVGSYEVALTAPGKDGECLLPIQIAEAG